MKYCTNCGEPLAPGTEACDLCEHAVAGVAPAAPAALTRRYGLDPRGQPSAIRAIDIPFWDLVQFLVKVAIAAVPATIIVALVSVFVFGLISAIFRG